VPPLENLLNVNRFWCEKGSNGDVTCDLDGVGSQSTGREDVAIDLDCVLDELDDGNPKRRVVSQNWILQASRNLKENFIGGGSGGTTNPLSQSSSSSPAAKSLSNLMGSPHGLVSQGSVTCQGLKASSQSKLTFGRSRGEQGGQGLYGGRPPGESAIPQRGGKDDKKTGKASRIPSATHHEPSIMSLREIPRVSSADSRQRTKDGSESKTSSQLRPKQKTERPVSRPLHRSKAVHKVDMSAAVATALALNSSGEGDDLRPPL